METATETLARVRAEWECLAPVDQLIEIAQAEHDAERSRPPTPKETR